MEMIEFRTRRRVAHGLGSDAPDYNEIYDTEPICEIDSFYKWAIALLGPRPGQALLDVSCGIGRLVHLASAAKLRATGIDFAEVAIHRAMSAAGAGAFVVGTAEDLPFADGQFDLVTNLGSLEHYLDPARAVREMTRMLCGGGRALVVVPNTFSILHVLYVWRHGDVYDDGQPLQRYGTFQAWRDLLERNGLRVVQTYKYQRVMPRRPKDVVWYARRPTKALQAILAPLLPIHSSACFAFVCEQS